MRQDSSAPTPGWSQPPLLENLERYYHQLIEEERVGDDILSAELGGLIAASEAAGDSEMAAAAQSALGSVSWHRAQRSRTIGWVLDEISKVQTAHLRAA